MSIPDTTRLERILKLALASETIEDGGMVPVNHRFDDLKPGFTGELLPQTPETVAAAAQGTAPRAKGLPLHLGRILVPVDFSEPSEHALAYATRFAEQFGAQLVLVHVVPPFVYSPPGVVAPPILELVKEVQRVATEKLLRWREDVAGAENVPILPPEIRVRIGPIHEEIVQAARELDVDLIIVATHGFTGMKRFFLGSTTEHLVRVAPCPVLVVREHEREFI